MEGYGRLLYFLLDCHAHVGVDASAPGCVDIFAELFVGSLNVVNRNFRLPNNILPWFGCQSFESDLSTRLYFR